MGGRSFFTLALAWLCALSSVRGGEVWEIWSRICYSTDPATEWLVAEDKNWNEVLAPDQTKIYLLVPPIINKVGDHWEITFHTAGKVKNLLQEHFDNDRAYHQMPGGYKGVALNGISFHLPGQFSSPWLMIRSKNFWDGRQDQPNVNRDDKNLPPAFNLDPEQAVGISFLEPTVTEKEGEWILSTAEFLNENQKEQVAHKYAEWQKDHPGPKSPPTPKIVYPPEMQKRQDAWMKALHKWQKEQPGSVAPKAEDFYQFTPEQKQQYEEWQKAAAHWRVTGGVGRYPQPIDFIKY